MKKVFPSLMLAAAIVSGAPAIMAQDAQQPRKPIRLGRYDAEIQQRVKDKLKDDKFKNVNVQVVDQIVTLSGNVDLMAYKSDADRKAHKVDRVKGVDNEIQVQGTQVSDAELQSKLSDKLRYDRVGYGNVFNAILMNVQNGVVTLKGEVRTPVDKESALAEVENTPGVKDIDEDIKVSPPSPMDDDLRIRIARAIYGDGSPLSRYATDPQAPIRIVVNGGHVALYGIVDSESDKTNALMRARQVPGSFSVDDHLVVASQNAKK